MMQVPVSSHEKVSFLLNVIPMETAQYCQEKTRHQIHSLQKHSKKIIVHWTQPFLNIDG